MTTQALAGLRVLEFGGRNAGAYCGRVLAGFGAEVVKVEPPGEGDSARRAGPFPKDGPHPEKSALFLYLNSGKKGITLDLSSAEGRRLALELAKQVDVLVESFEPRLLPALDLGYQTLQRENPRLVVTSITAFGQSGPYRDFKGPSMIASALGGWLYQNGEPAREPLSDGGWQAEFVAAWYGVVGTLAALHARRMTGRGQRVDVSAMESVAASHHYNTVLCTYLNQIKRRRGNRSDRSHPLTVYPAGDGYVAIAAPSADQWEALCVLLDVPELVDREGYETDCSRMGFADEIDAVIGAWTSARSKMEVFRLCQERRIPAVPVYDLGELLRDPHFNERDFWVWKDHPIAGPLVYPGSAARMAETPWQEGRAPLLGEHNRYVLGELLGLAEADIEELGR